MIEMVSIFELNFDSRPIRSFHLAEGPGGFIEALAGLRKCPHDKYVGMTIIDENNDPNIPGWKKTEQFLRQNKNVFIYGASWGEFPEDLKSKTDSLFGSNTIKLLLC
jgi:hypothetical protein